MIPFFPRLADRTLRDILSNQTRYSIHDPAWMHPAPPEFLAYCESAPLAPFDDIPEDPNEFREGATFLLAQTHRIWVTLSLIERHLGTDPSLVLLDVGGFPFAIDRAIRNYLHRDCRIIATVNQALRPEDEEFLREQRIETIPVNLDPLIEPTPRLPGMTEYFPLPDQSVDIIVFSHVIEHLYQPLHTLNECFRVLRPGGKLILSTDHGMMLGGFLNYLTNGEFVHEPVEGTAAMVFTEWRGHVRFYTRGDLHTLVKASGGQVVETHLEEIHYHSEPEQYFVDPKVWLPGWRAELLEAFPEFRNEILIVAERGPHLVPQPISNPFDPKKNPRELAELAAAFTSGRPAGELATVIDLAMGTRLLWGRWPTREEIDAFQRAPRTAGVYALTDRLLGSPEAAARGFSMAGPRRNASCVVMTEQPNGDRFFFSTLDTEAGRPIAMGTHEPALRAALDRLLRPGLASIDVAAGLGFLTVPMARSGPVWAIEADPFNAELLRRNLRENGLADQATILEYAAGPLPPGPTAEEEDDDPELAVPPVDGEAWLWRTAEPHDWSAGDLRPYAPRPLKDRDHGREILRVPMAPLDRLIPVEAPIGLLRIGSASWGPAVLAGARLLIERRHPVLLLRWDTRRRLSGYGSEALLERVAGLGYTVIEAAEFAAGGRKPFERGNSPHKSADLVCLPPGFVVS